MSLKWSLIPVPETARHVLSMCSRSYDVPLVADIHFQPAVAMRVADAFEKIRVNPGNYVDGTKRFDDLDLSEESMKLAKEEIREVCIHELSNLFFLEHI